MHFGNRKNLKAAISPCFNLLPVFIANTFNEEPHAESFFFK